MNILLKRICLLMGVILCSLICFHGCSSNSNLIAETNGIIEGEDIYFFLVSDCKLIPSQGSTINDRKYALPTKNWITYDYLMGLKNVFLNSKYQSEGHDCDAFTHKAKQYAIDINAQQESKLAIGEIYYIQESGIAHAINFALYKEKEKLYIIFIEPQSQSIVKLTQKELQHINHWRI